MITEKSQIFQFNVASNGVINVLKTTFILKDGETIGSNVRNYSLQINDPNANDVLGEEPFYLNIANYVWSLTNA